MQVTVRSSPWCPVCWRGPLPIHWLSCCSEPSAGLAPPVWDGCPSACMAFCSSCVPLWPQSCAVNVDLRIGARIYVWAGPWLWSCVSTEVQGWPQALKVWREVFNSSSELPWVALLLFPSPPAQSSKSGNLRLPTGRKEGEVIDGVVFSSCKVLGGCGGDCQVRS